MTGHFTDDTLAFNNGRLLGYLSSLGALVLPIMDGVDYTPESQIVLPEIEGVLPEIKVVIRMMGVVGADRTD